MKSAEWERGIDCLAFFLLLSSFYFRKVASLTGFAPVISCMRGRHVDWTTPQGP